MAACTPQGPQLLNGFKVASKIDTGIGRQLPEAYRKFYLEWRKTAPTPVHYIPKEGKWERDQNGITKPVQNVPIPVFYPTNSHYGIWGGEGVVKGFQKRQPTKKRVPHYWVPALRRTVLRSVILNKNFSTVVTTRTMDLVHENHGFDHYLLKTPACDLNSGLAFQIKRDMLKALQDNCPDVDAKARPDILSEYSKYAEQYTPEEIEWYGYTFEQAVKKFNRQKSNEREAQKIPYKIIFRQRLIEQLKEAGIAEAQDGSSADSKQIGETSSWLSKMNPFGKRPET
ncbi:39S ribosomal protein L28, mitochondrial [Bradysia coprophila]|uniref:39S ribosomal protein L28, mitochondrial n=1 Tax=Bradysia coprophila TaxID=38358 RepID=UPI00187DA3F0|nr:39S ribosomal protein L28, mitochondrial [Bradysia coprophila]